MAHLSIRHLEIRMTVPASEVRSVSLKPLVSPHGPYTARAAEGGVAAAKAMPNGDTVTISRTPSSDGSHEIVGTYEGTLGDTETVRFALYNLLFDLIAVDVLPPLQRSVQAA